MEHNFHFRGKFRSYQQNVLDHVQEYLKDKHIHIVAAPGSGKTILGLEILCRIGKPAIILSPSVTIRNQWKDRFHEFFIDENNTNSINTNSINTNSINTNQYYTDDYFSLDIQQIKLFNSITYQCLHSIMNKIPLNEENDIKDLSKIDIFEVLKRNNIKTICVDEAHHLQNEWQKSLERFIEGLDNDITIVALTATPPYDAKSTEWNRYIKICGEIDEEIFVPELVKEKTLCPHQDFIYFNYPTKIEEDEMKEYRKSSLSFLDEILSLHIIENVAYEINMTFQDNIDEIYTNVKEYVGLISLCEHFGYKINRRLIKILAIKKVPSLNLLYTEYALNYLLISETLINQDMKEELQKLLLKYHLIERGKVALELNEKLKRKLISSVGKLNSISKIVLSEKDAYGDDLRLLVLTDYIRKDSTNLIGTNDTCSSISVVTVFETIRRVLPEYCHIAILSGELVIIHKSLLNDLSTNKVSNQIINNTDYSIIEFNSQNKEKVTIVSKLFAEGKIKILIGTKSLLGEGWDSPCINSLILASFVGSFMLSNQMRGRAIRINKNDPYKVSSIWHLVTIEPEYIFEENILKRTQLYLNTNKNEIDSVDYDTVTRRFTCFVGPRYDNNDIESGIDRLSIINPPYDEKHIKEINQQMLDLSRDKVEIRKKWNEGLVKNDKLAAVNLVPKDKRFNPFTFINIGSFFILSLIESLFISTSIVSWVNSRNVFLGILTMVFTIILLYPLEKILYKFISHFTPQKSIHTLSKCIVKTLQEMKMISTNTFIKINHDKQNVFFSVVLENSSIHEQNIFNKAIEELLSPIENPRYLIIKGTKLLDYRVSYAAPQVIGVKKENAEIFRKHLKKSLGNVTLVYTRNEDGRKAIMKCRKHSYITYNAKKIGIMKKVNKYE